MGMSHQYWGWQCTGILASSRQKEEKVTLSLKKGSISHFSGVGKGVSGSSLKRAVAVLSPGHRSPGPTPADVVQAPQVFLHTVLITTPYVPKIEYMAKFNSLKIHDTVDTTRAPFGPDVHEIVCRLGLRPKPHWGSLQHSPDTLVALRDPTSKGEVEK